METRTVHDPFIGTDVQISNRLVDRLRGKYASGPHLPNGNPEFGWKQFQATPINLEAAERIEALETALREAIEGWEDGANYKGDYLREKHRDAEGIAAARAVLLSEQKQ